MATAVLVRGGPQFAIVRDGRAAPPTRWEADDGRAAELIAGGWESAAPPLVVEAARAYAGPLGCDEPMLRGALVRAGVPIAPVSLNERREGRKAFYEAVGPPERSFLLALAEKQLGRLLSSPAETLIALAREEERVEGAVRRELGAADQWLSGDAPLLVAHGKEWARFREVLGSHHRALEERLERQAHEVVPNLAELLGGRVAARLVALAGSVPTLGRMSASRLQMLGTKRRPSPVRGPRYGVIVRAARASDVPPDRLAAFARSLAALAVIAARADASTRARVVADLVRRRDRRVQQLRRRRSP